MCARFLQDPQVINSSKSYRTLHSNMQLPVSDLNPNACNFTMKKDFRPMSPTPNFLANQNNNN